MSKRNKYAPTIQLSAFWVHRHPGGTVPVTAVIDSGDVHFKSDEPVPGIPFRHELSSRVRRASLYARKRYERGQAA